MQRRSIFLPTRVLPFAFAAMLLACGRSERIVQDSGDSSRCETPLALCEEICVDLDHDPDHCGMCDQACGERAFCAEGSCVDRCPAPLVGCGRTCVDPSTSQEFCGATGDCQGESAGVVCSPDQVCDDGSCVGQPVQGCDAHLTLCDDLCVDASSSPLHCNACNQACSTNSFCFDGDCLSRCPEPLIGCGGTCIDPATSNEFCGASGDCQAERAGVACAAEEVCQAGSCLDDNAALADLSVLRGDRWWGGLGCLTPAFDPDISTYVAVLTREDLLYSAPPDATIMASPQSDFATLSINGAAVDSTEEYSIPLNASTPTLIDVTVTAESGRTQHYFVAVGATGEPWECPAICSTCGGEEYPGADVTFIEAIPADGALAVGSSTSFVFDVWAHGIYQDDPQRLAVDASLDGDFGVVTIDEPGPIFEPPGGHRLVTVTVEPSGQVTTATLNVTARPCAALHRTSSRNPITLTLGELPPEKKFYVNFVTSRHPPGPDGVIPIPAGELSLSAIYNHTYLLNPSSVERTYKIDVHLELDSGSHDDWNWPGEPTPFSYRRDMTPGSRKEIQIPLSWTSDGTPPVGTTGRLISTATTTIEGAPVSNTVEFPFIVAAPFTCQ